MRKFLCLIIVASLPVLGFGQIYGGYNILYPDVALPGSQWIGTSGASVHIPSTGIYRFSISVWNPNIPHDFVEVKVAGATVSTLQAGLNFSAGGTFSHLSGWKSFEVRTRMIGPFASCVAGNITIRMYNFLNQLISEWTVYSSTYATVHLKFKPTALVNDHKGFFSHRKVTAIETIEFFDGMTITPISTQSGQVDREFKIGTCVDKTGEGNPEFFPETGPISYLDDLEMAELRLLQNPAQEEIRLELANSQQQAPYQVVSADGKLVLSGVLQPGQNTIPVHDIKSGLYFIKCDLNGQSQNEKVLIQH